MNDLQRFIDRIGKRIYRDETTCPCSTCKEISRDWLIIFNEMHANYLYVTSWDYPIEYRDNA